MQNVRQGKNSQHVAAPAGGRRLAGTIVACAAVACFIAIPADSGAKGGFMDDYFSAKGLDATLVISSLKTKKEYMHNAGRARKRFSPASTFKIPNSLIALRAGAVKDGNELVRWDGTKRSVGEWNADHSMKTAFRTSCVWFYQGLARKIGPGAYRAALKELNYGNMKIGGTVDMFWLDGSLKISAGEQIAFLKAFYKEEFPFDKRSYSIVKGVMRAESGPGYSIMAKTGSYQGPGEATGWYVGYAETAADVWFFAFNCAVRDPSQLALRKEAVREALVRLGIIR